MSTTVTHRPEAEVTTDDVRLDTATIEVIAEIEAQVIASSSERTDIAWNVADDGLWVANYGGYYGGTVDQQGTHFFVADTFGRYVGDFRSLEVAQAKLAERLDVLLPAAVRQAA